MQLYPLPNVTPAAGSCNNWVASLNTPINWRQENIRAGLDAQQHGPPDGALHPGQLDERRARASSPSSGATIRSPPSTRTGTSRPSRSWSSSPTTSARRASTPWPSRTRPTRSTITRGGTDADAEQRRSSPPCPRIYPLSGKEYGDDVGHPVFWGAQGYCVALERGALPQQPGPVRPQGRLLGRLRQALLQGGRPRQHQQEERGHQRQRLLGELGASGAGAGINGWNGEHREHPGRLPAEGHDLRLHRVLRLPARAPALARPRVLRRRTPGRSRRA